MEATDMMQYRAGEIAAYLEIGRALRHGGCRCKASLAVTETLMKELAGRMTQEEFFALATRLTTLVPLDHDAPEPCEPCSPWGVPACQLMRWAIQCYKLRWCPRSSKDRALPSQGRGREFESHRGHQAHYTMAGSGYARMSWGGPVLLS